MLFAGVFAEHIAPYDPIRNNHGQHAAAAELEAPARHRSVRPRHLLAHHLWRAHRADHRPVLRLPRLHRRRDHRRGVGLFRRQDRQCDPALHRPDAVVPADRAGAGGGRRARPQPRLRDRHQPHPRDRDPDRAAGRARDPLLGAGDPQPALYRCGADRGLFQHPHRAAPHDPEPDGAVPDHADRLYRAGDPARSGAVVPRPRRRPSRCRPGG